MAIDTKNNKKFRLHESPELPIYGIPPLLQTLINEISTKFHCPREFVTVAVFSAISTAIGKRVKTFDGAYKNPLIVWYVLVANSGSNKTAPVKEIFRPLRDINKRNHEEFNKEFSEWRANKDRDETNPPRMNQIIVDDLTEEARTTILQYSKTGILSYQPEIKGFFDDLNRYVKSGAVSRVLRMFDGDQFVINRKGELMPGLVDDAFMNIFGDIQPDLLRSTFGNDLFVNNGMNQRFNFVMPDIIEYPDREIIHLDQNILNEWSICISRLYRREYPFPLLYINGNCAKVYDEYFNSLQRKKTENSDNSYLLSIFSKLQIQVQRLAGIVHMMWLAENSSYNCNISDNSMEYAICCMEYFEKNAIKVYEKIFDINQQKSIVMPTTQAGWIRLFGEHVRITNQESFSHGISKDPAYISKVLKGKA